VLLPVRLREDSSPLQLIEARVLERINADSNIALTLMTVAQPEDRATSAAFLDQLAVLFSAQAVTKKVVVGDNVGDLILDEATKDYDLMILGASEGRSHSDVLFTPLVDYVVRMSPCPTMLVQGERLQSDWRPRRILVPSNGSLASRRAAEVAFALVDEGEEVIILQVVEEIRSNYHLDARGNTIARQKQIAHEGVEKLRELGTTQGVPVMAEVEIGVEPEAVILETARLRDVDLIILGTNIGVGSDRLYLGPRVERILSNAPCPVIVINA
jgi:nucleotide-binding universal stress UspA family protein